MPYTGMAQLHAGEVVLSNHALESMGRMYAMMFNHGTAPMPGSNGELSQMVGVLLDIKGLLAMGGGMGGTTNIYPPPRMDASYLKSLTDAIDYSMAHQKNKPINITTLSALYPENVYKD